MVKALTKSGFMYGTAIAALQMDAVAGAIGNGDSLERASAGAGGPRPPRVPWLAADGGGGINSGVRGLIGVFCELLA